MSNVSKSFLSEIEAMSKNDLLLIVADQQDLYSEEEMQAIYKELEKRGEKVDIANLDVESLEKNLNVDTNLEEIVESAREEIKMEEEIKEKKIAQEEEKYSKSVGKNTERYERLKSECTGESKNLYSYANRAITIGNILAVILVIFGFVCLVEESMIGFGACIIAAIVVVGASSFEAMIIRGLADIDANSEISARLDCEAFDEKIKRK